MMKKAKNFVTDHVCEVVGIGCGVAIAAGFIVSFKCGEDYACNMLTNTLKKAWEAGAIEFPTDRDGFEATDVRVFDGALKIDYESIKK